MFLHPDPALSLTQMILGAEQTCQPHSQPGQRLTWKDFGVWLSFSQRNTHFYCFSLQCLCRACPWQGNVCPQPPKPNLGNPCGSRNPIPRVCQQNPSAASTGIPQNCRSASPLCKPECICTSSFPWTAWQGSLAPAGFGLLLLQHHFRRI